MSSTTTDIQRQPSPSASRNTGLISAICTPLDESEQLCREGLEAHIADQWASGISGLLVAGTMGLMQLLRDETYRSLIQHAVAFTAGKGEILVGVGDTSYGRTRDRIAIAQEHDVDGLVVVTPYLLKFSQADMIDYYRALANYASKPIYIYLLPALTGVWLEPATVLTLAQHPNIRGIKCSVPIDWTRQLIDRASADFRIIPAQPHLVDAVLRMGMKENLDGIFAVFPKLSASIALAAHAGRWDEAARYQQQLSGMLQLLTTKYALFPSVTVLLNERGIKGSVAPRPLQPLSAQDREGLLAEALVQEVIRQESRYEGVSHGR